MVLAWLICLKCLSCVYMFGAKCIFAFLHHAHTPVQIVYVHANRKVIDTMYGGNKKKSSPSTPMSSEESLQGNIYPFLSPDLRFHSNLMSQKYTTTPQIPQVFSNKGLGTEGRGQFQGVRKECNRQRAAACVTFALQLLAGWDLCKPLMSFFLVWLFSAAVTQLLSGCLLPPPTACVFVSCHGSLLICYAHAPPNPLLLCDMNFGSNHL